MRSLGIAALLIVLAAPRSVLAQPCTESLAALFERVSPTVVSIQAIKINKAKPQRRFETVVGSGVVIERDGQVLTNAHVVDGAASLSVTLDSGAKTPARVLGMDTVTDLALLRLEVTTPVPAASLGDSAALRVGDEVVAIGNPMGLEQTMTRGIVSGLNRLLPDTPLSVQEPLIQTDTPINFGNSGGPLLNRCGEVIGISSAIIPDAQNIGFAIPIDLAKALIPSLMENGRVIRPWIGFHGQLVDEDFRKLLQIPLVEGLLVEVVEPGSPAEKAGIQGGSVELSLGGNSLLLGGDIVVSINDIKIADDDALTRVMRGLKVGNKIRLRLFREGKYRHVEYVLPERPLLPGDVPDQNSDSSGSRDRGAIKPLLRRH